MQSSLKNRFIMKLFLKSKAFLTHAEPCFVTSNPSQPCHMHKRTLFILMPCDTPACIKNLMIFPFSPWARGCDTMLQSQHSSSSPNVHSITRRFCCRKDGKGVPAREIEKEELSRNCFRELRCSWGTCENAASFPPIITLLSRNGKHSRGRQTKLFPSSSSLLRVTGHRPSAAPVSEIGVCALQNHGEDTGSQGSGCVNG